jgi:peptidyl-prolyl cis-trans isomerase SurA
MTTFSRISRATLAGFLLLSSVSIWAAQPLDKVVAIVNNSVLTQNQLDATVEEVRQMLQATNQPIPSVEVLRKKALDKAIGELLQLQVAQRVGIKVTDADVERALAQVAKQNNITSEQLKAAVEKQGLSFAAYRNQIRDQIMMHQVQRDALGSKIQVSDAEAQAYLKNMPPADNAQAQYRIDDLLVPLKESATPDQVAAATKTAEKLLEKARAGANFGELATGSVQRTDLQWRSTQELPEVFVSAVSRIKVGEVAGPVRAPNGLHVLRLVDARGHTSAPTLAEARQRVMQKKMQQEVEKWVMELRKGVYIKIM